MKLLLVFLNMLLIYITSLVLAHAGDFAKREIHGFSRDGALLAFEEYGVQDGSGFPYSNIYIIDTKTDEWTAGSPFRVRLEDEARDVFAAREEASILAGPVMKSFEGRGNIVATYQATHRSIDTKRMSAIPRPVIPAIDDEIEFRLEEISFPSTAPCHAFGESKGFRLLKLALKDGNTTRVLHEDKKIPASRRCPLRYDLADLVTFYPEAGQPVFAVLIRMQTVGFEGPDGRFLAVTGQLR